MDAELLEIAAAAARAGAAVVREHAGRFERGAHEELGRRPRHRGRRRERRRGRATRSARGCRDAALRRRGAGGATS